MSGGPAPPPSDPPDRGSSDPARDPDPPTTGPTDPRLPGDVSTRPGDGALSRVDAVKDEHVRRWDVVTPSATLIGHPESPDEALGERIRALHEEAHPAMAGHSERMHRLEKARITHAFSNTLDLTPWERDRALGIMVELDLTAFGSQRAIERVALVVCKYVVDEERQHRLGLHDQEWLGRQSPAAMSMLYDRFDSLTDDPTYQRLLEANDLDTTAVNRLTRTLREQLDEQDLGDAVFGRAPHRDPALPVVRPEPAGEGEAEGVGEREGQGEEEGRGEEETVADEGADGTD